MTSSITSPHWIQRSAQKVLYPQSLSRSMHISWITCPLHRLQLCGVEFFVFNPVVWEIIVCMSTSFLGSMASMGWSGTSRTCVTYQRQIPYLPSVYPSLNEQVP